MEKYKGAENKNETYERKPFTSSLEKADGTYESISINLNKEGKPKIVVFEDIDKTLLHLEPTYNEIRKNMWPEAVAKDGLEAFSRVHLDGFRLGTMWRELYRIHAIYNLGKEEWKDIKVYEEEFLAKGKDGEHIDSPGDKYYEFSNQILEKFDTIAAETVEVQAKENPDFFKDAKIGPMYKLNTLYKRLGIPVVGMSANPKKFITAICKYTGLSEIFIDCATDTDVGGTKEYKMAWLIEKLEKKGLKVPYDKLQVIGDSPIGDVGSASRFKNLVKSEHPDVSASGIVIVENDEDIKSAIEKLSGIGDINIQSFNINETPLNQRGEPDLTSKHRDEFLSSIN